MPQSSLHSSNFTGSKTLALPNLHTNNSIGLLICIFIVSCIATFAFLSLFLASLLTTKNPKSLYKLQETATIVFRSSPEPEKLTRSKPKPVKKKETQQLSLVSKVNPAPLPKPNLAKGVSKITPFKPKLALQGNLAVAGLSVNAPQLTSDLTPLYRSPPQYPYRARQRGIEGVVELEFTITTLGTVKDITIIKSTPPRTFDRAAMSALTRWRFKPLVIAGKAVERRATQQIRFQLGESS